MKAAAAVRLAVALWVILAAVVWNVVFDRMVVLAGRRYVYAAALADQQHGHRPRAEDWMRPAVAHGVRTASLVSGGLLAVGLTAVALAARQDRKAFDS